MKQCFALPSGLSVFLLLACTSKISAHTWVEQLTVIASNGTFVGTPGYPRGFVARTAGVDPDVGMTYLLPPNGRSTGNAILTSDLMCKSSQTVGTQTAGSPALIASPGDQVALRYQENGHVTQPQIPVGKPEGSGTVYVYGTEKSANTDTYLGIHNVWNAAGTGGDGRGVLLATRHFDDGQCYQLNGGPISQARRKEFPHQSDSLMGGDLWCQTDVQIPASASGNYTLYWVWDWPTLDSNGTVTTNQSYTTCMDVVLTPSSGNSKAEAVNFASGQNIDYAGIAAQLDAPFLVNPTASEATFVSGSAPSTFSSSVLTATPKVSHSRSAVSTPSLAANGFITVTVIASVDAETVTITETVNGGASSPAPIAATSKAQTTPASSPSPSTTSSPSPSSAKASSSRSSQPQSSQPSAPQSTGSVPPIAPFLSPSSQIAKAPIAASTLSPTQAKPSTTLSESASAAATSDCPDMTPGAANGTVHERAFVLRGRVVRK